MKHSVDSGIMGMLNLHRATSRETLPDASAISQWLREKCEQNQSALQGVTTAAAGQLARLAPNIDGRWKPLVAVVDDEMIIAVTLAELLKRHGFSAVWFTSPVRALEFVKHVRIDLLLSDIQMPELNGLELSLQLAGIYANCPVLLLSGNSRLLEALAGSRAVKQNVFLAQKPIRVDRLVELLNQLLPTNIEGRDYESARTQKHHHTA